MLHATDTAQSPPLIVTLTIDPEAHAFFDDLRTAHFPSERLQVGAHITMFHAIPGGLEAQLRAAAADQAAAISAFPLRIRRLRSLGRGVAYDFECLDAKTLRAALAAPIAAFLTPQDRAAWSPHITIQNKVLPAVARETQAHLSIVPPPLTITAMGLALWRYRGGPWEALAQYRFGSR